MKKLESKNKRLHYSKNAYLIFSYFISCGIVGWIFETIVVLVLQHKFTARGILLIGKNVSFYIPILSTIPIIKSIPIVWGLPVIEIYGVGGCLIVILFGKIKAIPWLFLISVVSMTLLELLSSYGSSLLLHKSYWDYSNEFLNFQGRICLRSSITWGVISVIAVKFLTSKLELIYAEERRIIFYKNIMRIVFLYTLVCIIYKYIIVKA